MCVLNPALIFRTCEREKIAILGLACVTTWFCSTISLDRSINCSSDAGTVWSLWHLDRIHQRIDKLMPLNTKDRNRRMKNRDQRPSALSSVPRRTSPSLEELKKRDYRERMSAYSMRMEPEKQRSSFFRSTSSDSDRDSDEDSETNQLVQALATQKFHLPGNSWCQDWFQFFANNHPVFGICCHHRLHPIKFVTRVVALIGIITFGLAITNVCYVFFLWNPEYDHVLASFVLKNGKELTLTTR